MEVSIKEQLQKENFSTVSQPLPSVTPKSGNYVVGLESIERAKNQLMKLLDEENIRAIGVYGTGGVGKTTLMKMLNNELEENKTFAKVIVVTVSSKPDLNRIQDQIAKRLGLKLGDEDSDRAYDLSQRLKLEKTVLIILDDLWEELDEFQVGIPSKTEHKGCKIVMTSRKKSVCTKMYTDRDIQMELLSDEESWALFKLKAGEVVDSPTLQHVAKMVMRECKGLPLAIVIVGLSLKNNDNNSIWQDALRRIKSPEPTELEEIAYSSVISSLRLSYDFLEGDLRIRLYFLFCCLFPEDENIALKRLFWYGFGEDFLKVDGTLEDASNKGIFFAHRLKDSGLLLNGDYGSKLVKMHDVVRDAAMYIAMKDGHGFFVRARLQLEEWPESEGNEEYKRISLMYNNIRVLPDELKRPKLQTLLLQGNRCLEDIPNNFFTWMPSLRVLDLSHTLIKSLPLSLSSLTNLRTLCMQYCNRLQDVTLLGGLEKLEILNLNYCGMIRGLPLELSRLTNLKILNLRETRKLESIPFGVISKLTGLEILDMRDGFSSWDDIDEENVTGKIASFAEMASLNRLTDLKVKSKREECLFQDMEGGPWRKLNRFNIQVGEVYGHPYTADVRKKMKLGISSPNLANWVKVLLERTEEVELQGCKDAESLEELDVNLVGSNCLVHLSLKACYQMKYVIDFEKRKVPALCAAFANLQVLSLSIIPNLKKLYHGAVPSPPPTSFTNLQQLNISYCYKLKNLFTLNLAGGLHKLHSLRVWDCKSMEELISKDDEKEEEEIKEEEEELKMCKSLFPQLRKLDLYSISELTCFYSGGGGGRGRSGNMLFDFPSLEIIEINKCPKLKRLPFGRHTAPNLKKFWCEDEWLKGLEWPDDDDSDSIRSRLQSIADSESEIEEESSE